MKKTTEVRPQHTYKDTVFRKKENLLSLYNVVNGTAYTDTESLEITTLENKVLEKLFSTWKLCKTI